MKKKKKEEIKQIEKLIKETKKNISEEKDPLIPSIPRFFYKKIPKELKITKENNLVYFLDHITGLNNVGIIKKINKQKLFFEIIEINNNNKLGYYFFDQAFLIPENTKDFKKYKKYLNDKICPYS